MRIVRRLSSQPKHRDDACGDSSIYRSLAPSVAGMALCAACLCGTSWAWFTATTSAEIETTQSASYTVDVNITAGTTASTYENVANTTAYTLPAGTYTVTLTPTGTATAGYCALGFDGATYYTSQLATSAITFVVYSSGNQELTVTPQWGTYSGEASVGNDATIGTPSASATASEPSDSSTTDVAAAHADSATATVDGNSKQEESSSQNAAAQSNSAASEQATEPEAEALSVDASSTPKSLED